MNADTPTVPPHRIFIIGMMGSGKSSVGNELTRLTGWPFLDNDQLIERETGRSARQLLADGGEELLRAAESAALHTALELPPPAVLAVAAGVVLDDGDRERLRAANTVVWLHAAPGVLAARAVGADHRPWLDDDPTAWFSEQLAVREPLYREVADLVIDTEESAPAEVAEHILGRLLAAGGLWASS